MKLLPDFQCQFLLSNNIYIYSHLGPSGWCGGLGEELKYQLHDYDVMDIKPLPPKVKHERPISLQLQLYLGRKGLMPGKG